MIHSGVRFPDLPSPEEGIFESIHTGQRKAEQPVPGTLIPTLPLVPEPTIRVRGGIRFNATQVEAAVVKTIAVFTGKSDTELSLARQRPSTSWQPTRGAMKDVHGVHHGFPGCTSLSRPDTSHLTIRRWDVDRVAVGITAEREVSVGIQGKPIRIGQEISPSGDGTNSVGNCDIGTLSFTDARDLTYHPVDFQVATNHPSVESNTNV